MEFQCDFKYLTQYEHRIKVKTTFIEKPPIAANFPSNKIIQQDISATFSSSLNSSGLQNNTCPHHSNEEKRVSISVLSLWQIPEKNNLEKERFILAHSFRAFSPWSAIFIDWCLMRGRISWWWEHSWVQLLISWRPGSRETEGARNKIHLSRVRLQWPISSNLAPHLPFHYLPIMPSYYESIIRINPFIRS
jgi:hypothetical protein